MDAHALQRSPSKLVNNPHHQTCSADITNTMGSTVDGKANTYDLADALDRVTQDRRGDRNASRIHTVLDGPNRERRFRKNPGEDSYDSYDPQRFDKKPKENKNYDYEQQRAEIMAREASLSWDFVCKRDASPVEDKANRILLAIRERDKSVFQSARGRRGYGGQEHPRFMGDHFLYNADLIDTTLLYKVANNMPKGAHLHIHFNANLEPNFLLDIAKGMKRMFIASDIPLVPNARKESEPGYYDNFKRSRIRFTMLSETEEARKGTGNIFDPRYPVEGWRPMNFQKFLKDFGRHYKKCSVDEWLIDKLVFHEEEAHGWLQTVEGAWQRFNARTQMMKGLFNYETAYRKYTRACLHEFARDNIQYAEIRVNFMETNQLWTDEGEKLGKAYKGETDNEQILKIIIDECGKFFEDLKRQKPPRYFAGVKVIYCTPRSFAPDKVRLSLDECLKFKRDKIYGKWIAGQ